MNHSTPVVSGPWPYPDSRPRYGTVSRLFHWGMALGFAVVFTAALVHFFAHKSAVDELLWPVHRPTGALLMALVVLRTLWALGHARRRPRDNSAAVRWGHRALYLLMWAVPTIALLRQYGSGRAFEPFGLPLMAAREGDRIDWMVQLGGLLHGELGWVLLALIAGHIGFAFLHRGSSRDVMPRMIG